MSPETSTSSAETKSKIDLSFMQKCLDKLSEDDSFVDIFNNTSHIKYSRYFDPSFGLSEHESFAWSNRFDGQVFKKLNDADKLLIYTTLVEIQSFSSLIK